MDLDIVRKVQPFTMTSVQRIHAQIAAARHVARKGVPGAVVECGVWRGGSMMAAALALLGEGISDRDLYLFDTFDGMPPPGDRDLGPSGQTADSMLADQDRESSLVWAYASRAEVARAMRLTGYPSERIHLVEGLVQDTVPSQAPPEIALLRLDTDWYDSTLHELTHLVSRVPRGGIVVIDDYGYWDGARRAVDEFFSSRDRPFLVPIDVSRIFVVE